MFSSKNKEIDKKSAATGNSISQKEYLKKYLSGDTSSKKKKRKNVAASKIPRSKIVDDDLDLKNMRLLGENEVDLCLMDEDAPQIVGIIDERPPEIQALESYRNSKHWKVVVESDEISVSDQYAITEEKIKANSLNNSKIARRFISHSLNLNKSSNSEKSASKLNDSERKNELRRETQEHKSRRDIDLSPPRLNKKPKLGHDLDLSSYGPSRRHESGLDSSDLSPLKSLKKQKSNLDDRQLPPKPTMQKSNSLLKSSPSKLSENYKADCDSDQLPPRLSKRHKSQHEADRSFSKSSRKRKSSSDSDFSPPRSSKKQNSGNDSDLSPPRASVSMQCHTEYDSDFSPPRPSKKGTASNKIGPSSSKPHIKHSRFSDETRHSKLSKSNGNRYSSEKESELKDLSRYSVNRHLGKSSSNSYDHGPKKMTETLSGKKAGLQDAVTLKEENKKFKEKEDLSFKQMSAEISGEGVSAIVRDRKTGRRKDPEREREERKMKDAKDAVRKEKYEQWGKGLKQIEDFKERLENDLHEMSKPLARYADDNDLDDFLKKQEREDDPILEFTEENEDEVRPAGGKPKYKGSYPPNRFNIRPGYRWDGVDRSSGYEKQWFESQKDAETFAPIYED